MVRLTTIITVLLLMLLFSMVLAQSTLNGSLGIGYASNPCVSTSKLSNVPINISGATTTQIVPATAGLSVFVCKVVVSEAGTTNVTLETGTGASCGTNTIALTGPLPASWVEPSGMTPNYVTPTGYAICLVNSAAVQVSGSLLYVQQYASYAVVSPTAAPTAGPTATPTALATANYANALPGTTYPVAVAALPVTAHVTLVAAINCLVAQPTTGADIFGATGMYSIGAGLCNSAIANPANGNGAHVYDAVNGTAQANFTSPNGIPLGQYLIAGSTDGAFVNAFICALPYTASDCVETQLSDTSAFTAGNVAADIGTASDGTSRNATGILHIWAVAQYPLALSLANINTIASTTIADPYPTATATPTAGPTPTATPTAGPTPTATPTGLTVIAHVLVDLTAGFAYNSANAAPHVSWVGPGTSTDIANGMKAYNYIDTNEAYESDDGPAYKDICITSGGGGLDGPTDSGLGCPSNGTNNSVLALTSGGAYLGEGNPNGFASDPTKSPYYANHTEYLYLNCGCGSSTIAAGASTASFFDDTGVQSSNPAPNGFNITNWNAAYKAAYDATGHPWLYNGLISAFTPNYSVTTRSSGGDSGGGSSLFGGNGLDTTPILSGSAHGIGAMWEGCYGGASGSHFSGTSENWGDMENYELWFANHHFIMWCRDLDATSANSTQGLINRLAAYASFLLTYDQNYTMYGTYFATSSLYVMPETQIVPYQPLVANPNPPTTYVSSFEVGTSCSASAPNCIFVRKYAQCSNNGTTIGPCAVLVNPTGGSITIPSGVTTGYTHALVLSGSGILDGGTATFSGSIPTSMAAGTGAILN